MKPETKKEQICNCCSNLAVKDGFCEDCFVRIVEEMYEEEQFERALGKSTIPDDHIGYTDEF